MFSLNKMHCILVSFGCTGDFCYCRPAVLWISTLYLGIQVTALSWNACIGSSTFSFSYPRDAMLARVLAIALCPSVTSRCSVETDGWIELVFSMEAFFHTSYTVLTRNSGIFKNKGTSPRNFIRNFGKGKICFGRPMSIVKTCYRLSSTMWSLRAWQARF